MNTPNVPTPSFSPLLLPPLIGIFSGLTFARMVNPFLASTELNSVGEGALRNQIKIDSESKPRTTFHGLPLVPCTSQSQNNLLVGEIQYPDNQEEELHLNLD